MSADTYIVYVHTNKTNGKRYVGISKHTINIRAKKNGRGYRQCRHFASAIAKYGWDGFDHEILHEGLSKEVASFLENYYVTAWDLTNRDKGYNIQPGGLHSGGMSEEGRESLREHNSGLNARNQRPVVAFSKEGKKIGEFPLVSFAAESYGIKRGTVENHLRKGHGTCYNKIFRYKDEVGDTDQLPQELLDSILFMKSIRGANHGAARAVTVFDCRTGDKIAEFGSVTEAQDFCGGDVAGCLAGKQFTCGGKYIVKYSDDVSGVSELPPSMRYNPDTALPNYRKPILQYSLDGKMVGAFPSATEAARYTRGSVKSICQCATGKLLSSGGFVWRYLDSEIPFVPPKTIWEKRRENGTTNGKPVDQLDLKTGEVLATYGSAGEAARAVGAYKQNILAVIHHHGGHVSAKGFGWQYHK